MGQYFHVEKGYGVHVAITNIIKILSTTDVMLELKRTLNALRERNNYIANRKEHFPINASTVLHQINSNEELFTERQNRATTHWKPKFKDIKEEALNNTYE